MDKILVIEDADDLRQDILDLLRLEGYEVRGAEDGVVGVEVAREYRPALIICDIMMPELDGYGVLNELRKDPGTRVIPFVFLTAKTEKVDIRRGMGLGADDYLTKPFVTSDLLGAIRARLGRRAELVEQAERKFEDLRKSIITALPHELRTPLNSVIGFSELLIAEAYDLRPELLIEWAQHINEAGLRLYRLVENYLTFARISSVLVSAEYAAASRAEVANDPVTIIEFRATQKAEAVGRESDLVIENLENVPVRISDVYLGKIVDELVDNAFKFSESGTPVTIRGTRSDDRYQLSVRDEGRGMPPEQIEAIDTYVQFDRWFEEQQGMGLGLAIVQRLVELHQATLEIESVPDTHLTITVSLRLA